MPVLKCRKRVVSFRLSEEEYEALMAGCISNGARSLSDYARSAACRPLKNRKTSGGDQKGERSIRQLRNRIEQLDLLVKQLISQINSYRALGGEPGRGAEIGLNDPLPSIPESFR